MQILDLETIQDSSKSYGILFWAAWAQPSILIEQLLEDQAPEHPCITFGKVNVDDEEGKALVNLFGVSSVPTVVFLKNGKLVQKYAGSDPLDLLQAIQTAESAQAISLEDRLQQLIKQSPLMIFIKGTPSAPRCGFTRTLLNSLQDLGLTYGYFDILSDNEVREGLKKFSKWPTYPQIYVRGELLGGLDIFNEMVQNGQIEEIIDSLKE